MNSKYIAKLEREISTKTSFMSTSKWISLFSLINNLEHTYISKAKLLLTKEEKNFNIYNTLHSIINKQPLEEYWGTFELREIEWVFIPLKITHTRKNREEILSPKIVIQSIQLLEKEFLTGKKYEYEILEEGIKIYGYR